MSLLNWCHDHDVLYINTSIELWDPYKGEKPPEELTLYPRHMAVKELKDKWNGVGPSMVLEHRANPGLVSHFTKKALVDIALKNTGEFKKDIEHLLLQGDFPNLSKLLGVKVIHISERDSQITALPHQKDEFINTWSVEGFYEEGTAPSEIGWGTHEKEYPPNAKTYTYGPKNQIYLEQKGIQTCSKKLTIQIHPILLGMFDEKDRETR